MTEGTTPGDEEPMSSAPEPAPTQPEPAPTQPEPMNEAPAAGSGEPPKQGWSAAPPPAPAPTTKFCHACAASIDARAEICPKCGVRQPFQAGMPGGGGLTVGDVTTATGKSKLVASLLAIFLGSFGVHKFYLGDNTKGIVYLVFFWTAIPGIVGFIEGILWLVQSDQEWLAKYGSR
ncbi:MAG: NINE protein [Candidatus Limnocylindrales bacterium]